MAYVDGNFQFTNQETVIGGGPSLGVGLGTITTNGTATYTGTVGTQVNGTFRLPVFKNPMVIKGIRVYTTVAPGAGVTGLQGIFLNGTSVVGTATFSTTVGFVDANLTGTVTLDSHGVQTGAVLMTSTNSNELTMNCVGIGTASGSSLGSYSIDILWNNLFTV